MLASIGDLPQNMMGAGPQKSLAEVEPGKGFGQDGVQGVQGVQSVQGVHGVQGVQGVHGVQGVQVGGAESVEPQQAVLLVEKACMQVVQEGL